MNLRNSMKSSGKAFGTSIAFLVLSGLALLISGALTSGQETAKPTGTEQETFATAKQAASALFKAAGSFDVAELKHIFGPGSEALVSSQDSILDKNIALAFAAKAQEKNSIQFNPKNPDRGTVIVGNDDFPFAIPIVKRNGNGFLTLRQACRRFFTGASVRTNSMRFKFAEGTTTLNLNTR